MIALSYFRILAISLFISGWILMFLVKCVYEFAHFFIMQFSFAVIIIIISPKYYYEWIGRIRVYDEKGWKYVVNKCIFLASFCCVWCYFTTRWWLQLLLEFWSKAYSRFFIVFFYIYRILHCKIFTRFVWYFPTNQWKKQ